ncbi:hypothetical protein HK097_001410 [Rhizophlyctis rosea]|uniref:Uncharacterized protein n=1 Tax=Rhizophlyctis rosea TaxID=64517 RepID=A0AAD5S6S2_9FUNG|nr:hypothetical protein HK097_001410 [Rhizophlyctis rosea]
MLRRFGRLIVCLAVVGMVLGQDGGPAGEDVHVSSPNQELCGDEQSDHNSAWNKCGDYPDWDNYHPDWDKDHPDWDNDYHRQCTYTYTETETVYLSPIVTTIVENPYTETDYVTPIVTTVYSPETTTVYLAPIVTTVLECTTTPGERPTTTPVAGADLEGRGMNVELERRQVSPTVSPTTTTTTTTPTTPSRDSPTSIIVIPPSPAVPTTFIVSITSIIGTHSPTTTTISPTTIIPATTTTATTGLIARLHKRQPPPTSPTTLSTSSLPFLPPFTGTPTVTTTTSTTTSPTPTPTRRAINNADENGSGLFARLRKRQPPPIRSRTCPCRSMMPTPAPTVIGNEASNDDENASEEDMEAAFNKFRHHQESDHENPHQLKKRQSVITVITGSFITSIASATPTTGTTATTTETTTTSTTETSTTSETHTTTETATGTARLPTITPRALFGRRRVKHL